MNNEIVEVNGIKYQRIEEKPIKINPMVMGILMAAQMLHATGSGQKERPKVNIAEEYGKIQRKESDLSRAGREWVISEFEKRYKKI